MHNSNAQPHEPAEGLKRILAVDNDPSARRYLAAALSGDYEIFLAKDADEALELLRDNASFELIICDLLLPGSDGCGLIAKLRVDGIRTPILILSSRPAAEILPQALESGADDCLQKPADLNELRRTIRMLIARSGERDRAGKLLSVFGGRVAARSLPEGEFIELTTHGDSAQIDSFQRFAERLVAAEMSAAERVNLRLALEEMIQNAKEWGNRFDAAKEIRLAYRMLPDRVIFRIEDEGEGFEPGSIPDPSVDPKSHIQRRIQSGKRIGGWGLFMTRKIMDEVCFNEKGNVVRIFKYFHRPVAGEGERAETVKKVKSETKRFSNGAASWMK